MNTLDCIAWYLFPREALSIGVVESGLLVSDSLQACQLPVASFQVAQLSVEHQQLGRGLVCTEVQTNY